VLGGAGFLGSYLCEKLVSSSDYKSIQKVFEIVQPDVVFNLAVVPLPASLVKPKECIDKNIQITSTACELLRQEKYKTLIHISSSEAYGTAIYVDRLMDENHPTSPQTPYAASKLASDHIALSYHKTFGSDISIIRPFNMYGPRQNRESYAGVIPITIGRIIHGKSPIIHGDGLQTRDYSYVQDVTNIIPNFYENTTTRGKVINIASGREISIKKIIYMIMDIMDYSGDVIYTDSRPGDVKRHCGDITLARTLLGYKPTTSFEEGLRRTVEWYMECEQS